MGDGRLFILAAAKGVMSTVSASSLVPVAKLFPKVTSAGKATDAATTPLTLAEAAAEDAYAGGSYLNSMLINNAPQTMNSGGGANQLFSLLL